MGLGGYKEAVCDLQRGRQAKAEPGDVERVAMGSPDGDIGHQDCS
eukprot:CAMPEP_0174324806 /NCGR_PEP_ID=MMETSP0810-20121108/12750_1 /TAXON_ID=73025 ORGANISM="Eutreptiella gymnastica-like, Strain CCMP1594" /NCGR_SAMPLE_ID=MMETSP0810 /ASSEMBLY_ACC=CAM_ASM_000659 /LENGTH=44 /DNA_ID= /DNA_START= /DNA_END= /DNA_ORIENTATION=